MDKSEVIEGDLKSTLIWKDEGNRHFKKNEIDRAMECYSAGLVALNMESILTKVCTNLALCYFNTGLYSKSLLFAIAGAVFDVHSDKAFYRAALALEALKEPRAAFSYLEKISDKCGLDCGIVKRRLARGANKLAPLSEIELEKLICSVVVSEPFTLSQVTAANQCLGSVKVVTLGDILPLKTSADSSFKDKQYLQAIQQYKDCLSLFTAPNVECSPVVLISNMTQCQLIQDEAHLAALSALVAVTLDPTHHKSAYRLAEALVRLDMFKPAGIVRDSIGVVAPSDKTFTALRERIALAQTKYNAKMEWAKSTEKDRMEKDKEDDCDYELLVSYNEKCSMPHNRDKLLMGTGMTALVDSRVPEFHLEFMRAGRLTADCDVERCRKFLYHAFENAKSNPRHEYNLVKVPTGPPKKSPTFQTDFGMRFGEVSNPMMEWAMTAKPGDLHFNRVQGGYDMSILQSMSNSAGRSEKIFWGQTHVVVGFVDLSTLFHSLLSGEESDGPLRWVGYEASAYCVAKTRVVAEMMRIGADVTSVLQVSYSTGWSRKTKTQFREALASLLTPAAIASCEMEVSAYLRHWETQDVSLATANSKWLDSRTHAGIEIGNFKRTVDRVDFTHYYLTGQLLDCEVGSVVMFTNPHKRETLAFTSSFLHSVPERDALFDDKNVSCVTVAVKLLETRIGVIAEHVATGRIVLDIRLGAVSLDQPARVREISALKPWSMSWSNVCDYFHPRDFHKLARRCSAPSDTIHYAYSMNWSMSVFGTQMFDYYINTPHGCREGIERYKSIISSGKAAINKLYASSGMIEFMQSPPIYDIRNITFYTLGAGYYQKYVKAFFDFSEDKQTGGERAIVGQVGYRPLHVLNRACTQIDLTFSYDKEVKLEQ